MAEPIKDFHIEYGKIKNAEGTTEESKYVVIITNSKPVVQGQEPTKLIHELYSLDGIESVSQPLGRYTVSVQIARTFDPEEVLEEVQSILRRHASELILPTDAGKIVAP